MNKENRLIESFTTVGGIMLLCGAAVYITGWEYAPFMYLAGSVLFACGQFADRYTGDDRIMKRLRSQQVLGACFMSLAAAQLSSAPFIPSLPTAMSRSHTTRSFLPR